MMPAPASLVGETSAVRSVVVSMVASPRASTVREAAVTEDVRSLMRRQSAVEKSSMLRLMAVWPTGGPRPEPMYS